MSYNISKGIIFILLFGVFQGLYAQSTPNLSAVPKKYRKKVESLSHKLRKEGYNIVPLLQDDRFKIYGSIGDRFRNSAERTIPNLAQYKNRLHYHQKIGEGVNFVQKHEQQLKEAQQKYDISRFVIAAIIGIESHYGANAGSYNPFNVYVSMIAVGYRKHFARAQLKQLLEFTSRTGMDIFSLKSSYAGAISYAQFIPYSLNKWFVGDDIFDMHDNIMSVGNYLAYFKQKTGSLRKAILHYNTSKLYQGFVLDLADAIKQEYMTQQQTG